MITEAIPTEPSVAARIHAVAQAAYALEAGRIGCADFPPLRESLEELRRSADRFLIFEEGGQIVAALSFDPAREPVPITRLVVSPAHLRRGIATALLAELARRLPPAARVCVSTAQVNLPAVALYERLGFTSAGVTRSAEGIALRHFLKSR